MPFVRPANTGQFRRWRLDWFKAALVAVPLAGASAVFLIDGPPPAEALDPRVAEASRLAEAKAAQRSPAYAAALDAAQPRPRQARPGQGTPGRADRESARFAPCAAGASRAACVVDGDTFWYGGVKIRVADINTPELSGAQCPAERALAEAATARLAELLNAGPFALERTEREQDRHGRTLRVVTRGGSSLGEALVAEGLAERWQGYRRRWC